ncbi:hypothetical protein A2738_01715 [Candidatus Nomurabacteria bacterium RIFCSPHIGHO2_01_FULL_42_15]|uniref:N-acetyltransferase domain-containing protein n=1 Tax=Candidatus Nomurabacteria bacterium RIFCSPHIGHO2_01_FULL_42_15 TaxID=1801742 RepID=A0A1F6VG09_9BACT|nr:MAG: hypothetical protein A2738_01715 [Candidatus Nomurabacteria bacterium RIFCSPHIGHO2_01_FULL_42_15]OGI92997.1 MAG: hypothetical protein A3A99_00455 [Candidatus Nomurabacteria bacterium RIFCSPLOWO2_01_FULL_41_18]
MKSDELKNVEEENFKIEDAKPEDVEAIRAIVKDAWLEIYPNEKYGITTEDISAIDWFNSESLATRRKEIIENKDTVHTFVFKNDKKEIVGFCKVLKFKDYGEIDAMYVIPELQRRGLGKKLLLKGLEWLGSDLSIRLVVVKYNFNAIEFYKKFGFKETGNKVVYEGTQLSSGKDIPRIEMIKKATLVN